VRHPWKHRRRATDPSPPTLLELILIGVVLGLLVAAGVYAWQEWHRYPRERPAPMGAAAGEWRPGAQRGLPRLALATSVRSW
jgi:hypothetical protein